MLQSRFFTLALTLFVCLISAIEAAKTQTWKFSNWNKYKKATVGKPTVWDSAWGIQEHDGWLWTWKGAEKLSNVLVTDPSKKTKDKVIRVVYPKNSRNPEVNPIGGLGFKAVPYTITNKAKYVTLQYSVYFPKGFNFVRGGKLPGLFGGHGDCTGGDESSACFTTRLMWRDGGDGEIYAYLPESKQRSNLCDNKVNICNPDYGYSLGRNTFKFTTGKWISVRQVIKMNTAGKQDGKLALYVNGKNVINLSRIVYRTKSSGRVVGIMFHTFFGGSDSSWKTPKTQYSYFKNFSLKTTY